MVFRISPTSNGLASIRYGSGWSNRLLLQRGLDDLDQIIGKTWLADEAGAACSLRLFLVLDEHVRSQHQDRDRGKRRVLSQQRCRRESVEAGHRDVHQDDVR